MKVKENKISYYGPNPLWVFPELLLSCSKYSEDYATEYKRWFQIEIAWIFWCWTLWIEFDKIRS